MHAHLRITHARACKHTHVHPHTRTRALPFVPHPPPADRRRTCRFPGDILHDSLVDLDMHALYTVLFTDDAWFREVCRLKQTTEIEIGEWVAPF